MKKIAIAGMLNDPNIGDQFIGKTVTFLVKDLYPESETVMVDFDFAAGDALYYLTGIGNRILSKIPSGNAKFRLQYLNMRLRQKEYYRKILKDVDALIFACGSFKYGTQRLWMHYTLLIECCEEKNIPVMFDAMNIQKYNQHDWRCLWLKDHLNRKCVKYITTRDGKAGVKRLQSDYITNQELFCCEAGDPALWIPECYGIRKQSSDTVGINLIRPNIFKNYSFGSSASETDIVEMYEGLILHLIDSGVKFELFTNGMKDDLILLDMLLKRGKIPPEVKNNLKIPANGEDLAGTVSRYSTVWAARLHACICSLSFHIPVVCFAWDEKLVYFTEYAGINEFVLKPGEINPEKAINCLDRCMRSQLDAEKLDSMKLQTRKTIQDFINRYAQ